MLVFEYFSTSDSERFAAARAIRDEVFIQEQGVSAQEEWDELDHEATHVLAYDSNGPIAVASVRILKDEAKFERIALRKSARGNGYGIALLHELMKFAREQGAVRARLSAQSYAIPFYEKCGFIASGAEYMEAGIPHKRMERAL